MLKSADISRHILLCVFLSGALFGIGQALTPKEFKKQVCRQKGVIVDVRNPEEFTAEKIKDAINLNTGDKNFIARLDSLDNSKSYFLYDDTGKRSARTAIYMRELGFIKVYELEGGLKAWKEKKYKTVISKP